MKTRSKTRTKTRTKISVPDFAAAAELHAKLDALVRANSPWMPMVTLTIESAYNDSANQEPRLLSWVN